MGKPRLFTCLLRVWIVPQNASCFTEASYDLAWVSSWCREPRQYGFEAHGETCKREEQLPYGCCEEDSKKRNDSSGHDRNLKHRKCLIQKFSDFPGGPLVRLHLPMQSMWVRSLVGEQISWAFWPKNRTYSRSNSVTDSIKTLKMIHVKIIFKEV